MKKLHGTLRSSVIVEHEPGYVRIDFALWSIAIPSSHVDGSERLSNLLSRLPVAVVDPCDPLPIANLFSLLASQGCLEPLAWQDSCHQGAVKTQFFWFSNEWYGRYYSHPVWQRMRLTPVPMALIKQWISRTYFLSRFAGVTAALASINAPNESVAGAFRKSAVEEYSHCDDYYTMPAVLFDHLVGADNIIAPAACFQAFDEQMAAIARGDWLAHLFVALFQEQTVRYRSGADRLYERIELEVDHPGLFDGWREHIGFDEDHAHEDDLAKLLSVDLTVSTQALQRSLDEASLAIELLIDGLWEVLTLGGRGIHPRECARSLHLQGCNLRGIRWLPSETDRVFKVSDASELAIVLVELISTSKMHINRLDAFLELQLDEIHKAMFRCLAACRTHRDIISIGRACEAFPHLFAQCGSSLKTRRIMRNSLEALAHRPDHFMFAAYICMRLIKRFLPDLYAAYAEAADAIEQALHVLSCSVPLHDLMEIGLRWIDVLEYGGREFDKDWCRYRISASIESMPLGHYFHE